MIRSVQLGCSLFLASLWFGLPAAFAAEPAEARSAESLLAEGDRLADEAAYGEAVLRYKLAYDQIVPRLRGLEFKKPVEARLMDRSELKDSLVELIGEEMPAADMTLLDRSLKAFGFVPASLSAEATMIQLLTEEVGGYYDPKTKKITLISEANEPQSRGLIDLFLGPRPAFSKEEQRAALAHEMAHALADQHFDLEALHEAVKDDDDLELALSALIEGEAMIVMIAEMLRETGDPQAALLMPPGYIDMSFTLVKGFLPFMAGKAFRQAPAIFRESLTFPYFKGMVFVLHLTNRGGWDAVNNAFRHPPLSTEQILHPEKFYATVDVPVEIGLPRMADVIERDWKKLGENVLGEFQTAVLLRRHRGRTAAAGWDGDRYVVFEGSDERLGLVWYSTWDTLRDAQELATAYARYRLAKLGHGADEDTVMPEESSPSASAQAITFRIRVDGRDYVVRRRGQDVAIVEGFSSAETDAILSRLSDVTKTPKRFPALKTTHDKGG